MVTGTGRKWNCCRAQQGQLNHRRKPRRVIRAEGWSVSKVCESVIPTGQKFPGAFRLARYHAVDSRQAYLTSLDYLSTCIISLHKLWTTWMVLCWAKISWTETLHSSPYPDETSGQRGARLIWPTTGKLQSAEVSFHSGLVILDQKLYFNLRLISLWGQKETNIYLKSHSHVANSCSATVATPLPHLGPAVPSLHSCLNAGPSFQPPSNRRMSGSSNVISRFCKFFAESMFSSGAPGVSLDHLKLWCCWINVHFNVSPLLTFCHIYYRLFFF